MARASKVEATENPLTGVSQLPIPKYSRRVIRIKAEDSPNVKLALVELGANKPASNRVIVPGVLDYLEYRRRRASWDPIRQCVGLDGEFYTGGELLLIPKDWLALSDQIAENLKGTKRGPYSMGVDSAEGGDNTVWAIIDKLGVIDVIAQRTIDTTVITAKTIALINEYSIDCKSVIFDQGGGGKQHVDRLRSQGYSVTMVNFGETVKPVVTPLAVTKADAEYMKRGKYSFYNRRAQMYWMLREKMDPATGEVFAIPKKYEELRRQLSLMPLLYDAEGRILLPPKRATKHSTIPSLIQTIGHSPDEADALAMAVYAEEPANIKPIVVGTPLF